MKNDCIEAHAYCTNNREELKKDTLCGCFCCCRVFTPDKITEWIEDKSGTAVCPFCGVDSVIGKHSGYPITPEFLAKMKKEWF